MNYQNTYYPESRFGGITNVDGTVAFYMRIQALANPAHVILDVGCGRGAYSEDPISIRKELRIFRRKCKKVIGIDVDGAAKKNEFIDEFRLMDGFRWPIEDNTVDICICDNVLEHIKDIELFFSECKRVLKKGGYVCIRTPNLFSYISISSKMVPNKFHARVLRKTQNQKKEEDTFPAFYKCNTIWRMKDILKKHGFDCCVYCFESEPQYLYFSHFFYFLGVLHQKLAPNMLKAAIFAFGKKK